MYFVQTASPADYGFTAVGFNWSQALENRPHQGLDVAKYTGDYGFGV
jgi:hypothetical protein